MMTMTLNGKSSEPIDITSFSRNLNVPDPNIRFDLNLNFSGDYSPNGIEYLANYADNLITHIRIVDASNNNVLLSPNIKAKIQSLNESCDENGKYGYATITIYEANATIPGTT